MDRLKYGPHTLQVPTILRYQIYTLDCLSTSAKSRKKGMETIVPDTKSLHRKPSKCKTASFRIWKEVEVSIGKSEFNFYSLSYKARQEFKKSFDTPLLIDGIKLVRNQPVCNNRRSSIVIK